MHVVFARSSSSTTLSAILFMLAAYNLSPLHHHCSMPIQDPFLSYCDSLMKRCLMRDNGQGCSDWLYFYGQGACTCSFQDNNVWLFLLATKQLYKWYFPSVRLSHLFVHHCIIMKFSGVITNDQSKVHAKGQGQRSRSQRSQPNLTLSGL